MVHLLRRDVVDGSAGRHFSDVGCIGGLVATDVAHGRVLDALFGVYVFGCACDGPIFVFGLAVDDEAGEGV